MVYLRTIRLMREQFPQTNRYPFTLPSIRQLEEIEITSSVTYALLDAQADQWLLFKGGKLLPVCQPCR